jgi:uncharacterized protein YndB with AHSA1/START domain
MNTQTTDRIEKEIFLRAPRARVWRALTEPQQFGAWFGVKIDEPFAVGKRIRGAITHPGYEHVTLDITIEEMVPERRFSWRWHPNAIDASRDYSNEPTTLVVFELDEAPGGTTLRLVESGFDRVPIARRLEAFRGNSEGWAAQMENIARHVGSAS